MSEIPCEDQTEKQNDPDEHDGDKMEVESAGWKMQSKIDILFKSRPTATGPPEADHRRSRADHRRSRGRRIPPSDGPPLFTPLRTYRSPFRPGSHLSGFAPLTGETPRRDAKKTKGLANEPPLAPTDGGVSCWAIGGRAGSREAG